MYFNVFQTISLPLVSFASKNAVTSILIDVNVFFHRTVYLIFTYGFYRLTTCVIPQVFLLYCAINYIGKRKETIFERWKFQLKQKQLDFQS